ncbi:DUF6266 family protein [Pedobacter nyackensis]|uniref:Uncharacterized protein n=1 Tax=Pedobacter nyackensis TaxID=475255 RepID=A0A1W2ER11_9SPHI|nr:DUF6266 family protein [Pedobacter nyackensis]SMD11568.1 hypothetical protein SAMN04488101_11452 [Pedobacter nyackensis]
MAIFKKGIFGAANGKIFNLVSYPLKGQQVVRGIGKSRKPLTDKQLNNKLQMKVIMDFFRAMDTLLRTGFNPKANGTTKNYHNLAIAYNKPNALKGFYPDVEVDYSKIIISVGDLPQPVNPKVEWVETGLKFTWNAENMTWPYNRDQVMLLAYAPAIKKHVFFNSGARRMEGQDILKMNPAMRNQLLEVYISFVSDDRLRAANSLYLGQVIGA